MRTLGALVFQETVLQCCYNLKPMHRTEFSRLLVCSRILFCTAAAAIIAVLVSKPLQEKSRRVLCFPADGFVLGLTAARSKFGKVSMSKELFLCMHKKKAGGAAAYTVMVDGRCTNSRRVLTSLESTEVCSVRFVLSHAWEEGHSDPAPTSLPDGGWWMSLFRQLWDEHFSFPTLTFPQFCFIFFFLLFSFNPAPVAIAIASLLLLFSFCPIRFLFFSLSKASTNMMIIVIVARCCHHIELPLPACHVALGFLIACHNFSGHCSRALEHCFTIGIAIVRHWNHHNKHYSRLLECRITTIGHWSRFVIASPSPARLNQ